MTAHNAKKCHLVRRGNRPEPYTLNNLIRTPPESVRVYTYSPIDPENARAVSIAVPFEKTLDAYAGRFGWMRSYLSMAASR